MKNVKDTKVQFSKPWGGYTVLDEDKLSDKKTLVKEMVVEPNRCLSYQRHDKRSEIWFVKSGTARVIINAGKGDETSIVYEHQHIFIERGAWHQLINPSNKPLHIIEIQYGDACEEDDIVRKHHDTI
jgi:mannose-6-phosphate isomerase-like protein (cupin superfamily)